MEEFAPYLISWNLTGRCNLGCAHCYLDASSLDDDTGDLTTKEAMGIVDQIGELAPGAMLVLTGGEPLLRPDVYDIASHASGSGLTVVLGTNGTLLDDIAAVRLKRSGVSGVGISLDSTDPSSHEKFRGMPGSWNRTMQAIDYLKRNGLEFQLQFTVTKGNYREIPELIELAYWKGAKAANVFFLVCTGRGEEMTDITPGQYESMLDFLAGIGEKYEGKMMVRARCAPHFLRIAQQKLRDSSVMTGATSGCIAGRGYFRITPSGDVTPCPYMPMSAGNIRNESLKEIWKKSALFASFRTPSYNGKCGECNYREMCGGCRARAYAANGDAMGEDPWCEYDPDRDEKIIDNVQNNDNESIWDEASLERLGRVPVFLRGMVRKEVERYARAKGVKRITPRLMKEMRSKIDGKR